MAYLQYNNKNFEIQDLFTIGSDHSAQLRINSNFVAAKHCKIEKINDGYKLHDLESSGSIYINGCKTQESLIKDGDEINIADHILTFSNEKKFYSNLGLETKNPDWSTQLTLLGEVAKTEFPVLLLGPSGAGKEVIANAIHKHSNRAQGPFQSVNCSALTESLIESEIFGHVKGSYTGAISDRKGSFEAARGGTLFLDEIGDLSYNLQAKLLRALENSEIRPVGSDKIIKTDVRVIAATHQNLIGKIQNGEFRADLYYRLNVMTATIPALRNRLEDFDQLLYTYARKYRVRFSIAAIKKLKQHSWPGNIRELKNTVARAATFFPKQLVDDSMVERIIDPLTEKNENTNFARPRTSIIKEIEKQMIIQKLSVHSGNQRRVALELGLAKSTLHDRMKYYNIDPHSFKPEDSRFKASEQHF
jgi:transcriptional regulator with PAS, ATPase and Fis domain